MLGDPPAGRELPDQGAIELAAAVVEIFETGLTHFELRFLEAASQRPILTGQLLGIDEHPEALVETERRGGGIALLGEVGLGHRGQAQVVESVDGLFSQHAVSSCW